MNKKTLKVMNVPKSKRKDYSTYTATELVYTLGNVLEELHIRDDELVTMQSKVDKERNNIYHDIEFNEYDNKGKIENYNKLKETLENRRKIKNEKYLLNKVNKVLPLANTRASVNNMIRQLATSETKGQLKNIINNNYKKGEVNRLKAKYLN